MTSTVESYRILTETTKYPRLRTGYRRHGHRHNLRSRIPRRHQPPSAPLLQSDALAGSSYKQHTAQQRGNQQECTGLLLLHAVECSKGAGDGEDPRVHVLRAQFYARSHAPTLFSRLSPRCLLHAEKPPAHTRDVS